MHRPMGNTSHTKLHSDFEDHCQPIAFNDRSITDRLLLGVPWVVGGRMVGAGCGLLANVLLARLLTNAQYGSLVFEIAVIFFFMEVAKFGLDRSLMRFLSEHTSGSGRVSLCLVRQRCMRISIFSIGAAVVGAFLVSPLLVKPVGNSGSTSVTLSLIAAGIVGLTLLHLNAESLRGLHDLKFCSVMGAQRTGPQIAVLFLSLLSIWTLMSDRMSVEAALALFVVSIWVTYASSQYSFWRVLRKQYSGQVCEGCDSNRVPKTKDILKISFTLVLLDILNCSWEAGEAFVAGLVISETELALYGAASQLMFLIVMPNFLALQMIRSSIPVLYSQGRMEDLQRLLQSCSGVVALVAFIPFLILFIYSESLFGLTYGASYREASNVLRVLLVGRIANIVVGTSLSVLLFTGRQRAVLHINIVSVFVMICLGAVFAPIWGACGFAVGAACARTLAYVLYWLFSGRLCGIWPHSNVFVVVRRLAAEGSMAGLMSRLWPVKAR